MNKTICDKCGEEKDGYIFDGYTLKILEFEDYEYHFCRKCYSKFSDWCKEKKQK